MSTPSNALRTGRPDATVEKYLADHVLRGSLIANEPNDEPKHPHVVARKQHLHCKPIAVRDSSDQHLVWCRLHFRLVFSRTRLPFGSSKACVSLKEFDRLVAHRARDPLRERLSPQGL
jgi:hypothetical protein